MIDFNAARAAITEVLEAERAREGSPLARVRSICARGADNGPVELPAVVLGQPEVDFDTQPCTDTVTFPIAVAVALDGHNLPATQQELEVLWVSVSQLLRAQIDVPPLALLGHNREVTRAEPGEWDVQGASHPAYVLTLHFYG